MEEEIKVLKKIEQTIKGVLFTLTFEERDTIYKNYENDLKLIQNVIKYLEKQDNDKIRIRKCNK